MTNIEVPLARTKGDSQYPRTTSERVEGTPTIRGLKKWSRDFNMQTMANYLSRLGTRGKHTKNRPAPQLGLDTVEAKRQTAIPTTFPITEDKMDHSQNRPTMNIRVSATTVSTVRDVNASGQSLPEASETQDGPLTTSSTTTDRVSTPDHEGSDEIEQAQAVGVIDSGTSQFKTYQETIDSAEQAPASNTTGSNFQTLSPTQTPQLGHSLTATSTDANEPIVRNNDINGSRPEMEHVSPTSSSTSNQHEGSENIISSQDIAGQEGVAETVQDFIPIGPNLYKATRLRMDPVYKAFWDSSWHTTTKARLRNIGMSAMCISTLSLWMVGPAHNDIPQPEKFKPTIIVNCSQQDRVRIYQELRPAIRHYGKPLGLEVLVDARFTGNNTENDVVQEDFHETTWLVSETSKSKLPPSKSLVGTSLSRTNPNLDKTPMCTLGGIIQINNTMFALTVAHWRPDFFMSQQVTTSSGSSINTTATNKSSKGDRTIPAGQDWMLLHLKVNGYLPNTFNPPKSVNPHPVLGYEKDADITDGDVWVCGSVSGIQAGYLSTVSATLLHQNIEYRVYDVSLVRPLENGDSGAWVVKNQKLCGYIITRWNGVAVAQMIPVQTAFQHIEDFFFARTKRREKVSLPTPEAIERARQQALTFGPARPGLESLHSSSQPTPNKNAPLKLTIRAGTWGSVSSGAPTAHDNAEISGTRPIPQAIPKKGHQLAIVSQVTDDITSAPSATTRDADLIEQGSISISARGTHDTTSAQNPQEPWDAPWKLSNKPQQYFQSEPAVTLRRGHTFAKLTSGYRTFSSTFDDFKAAQITKYDKFNSKLKFLWEKTPRRTLLSWIAAIYSSFALILGIAIVFIPRIPIDGVFIVLINLFLGWAYFIVATFIIHQKLWPKDSDIAEYRRPRATPQEEIELHERNSAMEAGRQKSAGIQV